MLLLVGSLEMLLKSLANSVGAGTAPGSITIAVMVRQALTMEIIYGLNVLFDVCQYWVPHRQEDVIDNLSTADIPKRLVFQRKMEGELQDFLDIGVGCYRPPSLISSTSWLMAC